MSNPILEIPYQPVATGSEEPKVWKKLVWVIIAFSAASLVSYVRQMHLEEGITQWIDRLWRRFDVKEIGFLFQFAGQLLLFPVLVIAVVSIARSKMVSMLYLFVLIHSVVMLVFLLVMFVNLLFRQEYGPLSFSKFVGHFSMITFFVERMLRQLVIPVSLVILYPRRLYEGRFRQSCRMILVCVTAIFCVIKLGDALRIIDNLRSDEMKELEVGYMRQMEVLQLSADLIYIVCGLIFLSIRRFRAMAGIFWIDVITVFGVAVILFLNRQSLGNEIGWSFGEMIWINTVYLIVLTITAIWAMLLGKTAQNQDEWKSASG